MIISYMPIEHNNCLKLFNEFNNYTFYIIKGLPEIFKSKIISAIAAKKGESTELILSSYNNLSTMFILHKYKTAIVSEEYLPKEFITQNEIIIFNIKNKMIDNVMSEEIKISHIYIHDLKARVNNYIKTISIIDQELELEFCKSINHQKVDRFITRAIPSGKHLRTPRRMVRYSNLLSHNALTDSDIRNIYIFDKFGPIGNDIIQQASKKINRERYPYVIFKSQIHANKYDRILISEINLNILSTAESKRKSIHYSRFIDHQEIRGHLNKIHILYQLKNELIGECKTTIQTIQKFTGVIDSYYSNFNQDEFIANIAEKIDRYMLISSE